MESCRFVVLRSPRGRLGSELDMGSRLRRMRGRFDQWMQIKTGPQQFADNCHDPQKFSIQSSLGAPRIGACGLGDHPTSDLSQRESASRSTSEKSKQFGPDGAPVPVKNVNYPRAPSSRRSGLVGPHTTSAIVNYKYMTSTRREGYFGLPTLGT